MTKLLMSICAATALLAACATGPESSSASQAPMAAPRPSAAASAAH